MIPIWGKRAGGLTGGVSGVQGATVYVLYDFEACGPDLAFH